MHIERYDIKDGCTRSKGERDLLFVIAQKVFIGGVLLEPLVDAMRRGSIQKQSGVVE